MHCIDALVRRVNPEIQSQAWCLSNGLSAATNFTSFVLRVKRERDAALADATFAAFDRVDLDVDLRILFAFVLGAILDFPFDRFIVPSPKLPSLRL